MQGRHSATHFNPSSQKTEAGRSEFEASQVYIVSCRLANATLCDAISNNNNNNNNNNNKLLPENTLYEEHEGEMF